MMKLLKAGATLSLLGGLLLPQACVHVKHEKKPIAKANLFISRGAKETTLQWESQVGVLYTIMQKAKNSRSGTWTPIPDAQNIRGTGSTMIYVDHPRRGLEKSYRLNLVPMKKIKK